MKRVLIAAAVATGVAGCGTCRNLIPSEIHEDPPLKIYGGVTRAADNVYASPHGTGAGMPFVWPFVAADVAGSAVADTFTLPLTVTVEACRQAHRLYYHFYPKPIANEPPTLPESALPEALRTPLPPVDVPPPESLAVPKEFATHLPVTAAPFADVPEAPDAPTEP